MSLAQLMIDACGVKPFQIAGLPRWANSGSDAYDLDAKIAGETAPTVDQVRLMLQRFLADRFQLQIRHESRILPVNALVPGKGGVKLIPNDAPCPMAARYPGRPPKSLPKTGNPPLPWAFYAQMLTIYASQPVIDESGLKEGGYCTADGVDPLSALGPEMDAGASIFTAIEDVWGIRFESKKGAGGYDRHRSHRKTVGQLIIFLRCLD